MQLCYLCLRSRRPSGPLAKTKGSLLETTTNGAWKAGPGTISFIIWGGILKKTELLQLI